MISSEAILQVFCGATPRLFYPNPCSNLLAYSHGSITKCKQRSRSNAIRFFRCSNVHTRRQFPTTPSIRHETFQNRRSFHHLSCKCQTSESVSGFTAEDANGTWVVDNHKQFNTIQDTNHPPNLSDSKDNHKLKKEKDDSTSDTIEDEAWDLLRDSIVNYCGSPIGTIAAKDPTSSSVLNYDQVFIRDFIPSGIAFLLKGEYDIVRSFILHTLQLQSWEKTMDCHSPGQGLMPASFKVRTVPLEGDDTATEEVLDPDFGEAAIGRVAPVDSGLWWIILLRAYGKSSGDLSLQERIDVQTGIKMILKLCLADGFDMFPTLLVADGPCMIDRRMGIHGHPLEIQSLFYSALLCAREMLAQEEGSTDLIIALNNRLVALSFHIREYYWIDMKKLNEIYRYKTEEYSYDAVNKFNIYPDQISPWLVEWMPNRGGYLIGNLQPAHMDFRFFSLGNFWSVVSSLVTVDQSHAILDLIEAKWADLVADMPFKICYPALEGQEWQIITGSDPKNTPWSYHNGGSWPTLLWQLTVACIKMGRPEIAERAVKNSPICYTKSSFNFTKSSSPLSMSIFEYNGSALVAMVGKNCFAIASDRRLGVQLQTIATDFQRIFKIHDKLFLGLSGLGSDAQTLHQRLVFRHKLYQLREERDMKPETFASLVSAVLYEKRFGPYFCQPVIAGLGDDDKPFICTMDSIGAKELAKDFVVAGTASESLYGACESMFKPDMEHEELFETISQALLSSVDRDCLSGWGGHVYLVTPTEVTERILKGRMD